MNTAKLSDTGAHASVIESIKSMTREEAQWWLDHVAEVFGSDDTAINTSVRNGSHPKSTKSAATFFQIKTSSHRSIGEMIELPDPLPVDKGSIPAGRYFVIGRADGVAEITSAGYDINSRVYIASPGPTRRINPALLVWFVPCGNSAQ